MAFVCDPLFVAYDQHLRASSLYRQWKKANPGEAAAYEKWAASIEAGAPSPDPSFRTEFGMSMLAAGRLGMATSLGGSSWLLDWLTYGRDVSWSYPASYDVTLTTLAAFQDAIRFGTGVAAGQKVLVTGGWVSGDASQASAFGNWRPASETQFYFDDGHQPGGSGQPIISQVDTTGFNGLWIGTGKNLSFFGMVCDGAANGGIPRSEAILIGGATNQASSATQVSNIKFRGVVMKNWGSGGLHVAGNGNSSPLSASTTIWPSDNLDLDFDDGFNGLYRLNDAHGDGTGLHSSYLADNGGGANTLVAMTNCKISAYAHDYSNTYGDVQIGPGSGGNNEYWIRAKNLTYRNTAAHPSGFGATANWKASPCLTFWGAGNVAGDIVHTVEAINVYGLCVEAESLNTGGATVQHGRQHSALVDPDCATFYSNQPYYAISGMTYSDCT